MTRESFQFISTKCVSLSRLHPQGAGPTGLSSGKACLRHGQIFRQVQLAEKSIIAPENEPRQEVVNNGPFVIPSFSLPCTCTPPKKNSSGNLRCEGTRRNKAWSEPKKLLAILGGGDQPPPKVSMNFFPNAMMRSDSSMRCSQSSRNLPRQDDIHDFYVMLFLLSYLWPVVIYLGVRLVEIEDHVNPISQRRVSTTL